MRDPDLNGSALVRQRPVEAWRQQVIAGAA
jgi:hypothetical protein